jgi:hypothetical protein
MLVVAVVVHVTRDPAPRLEWLSLALRSAWRGARVIRLRCHTDRDIAPALCSRVLPTLPEDAIVAVFRGNNTAIVDARLRVWTATWMQASAELWVAGTAEGAVQWGAFAGMAGAMAEALGRPSAGRLQPMAALLASLAARSRALIDDTDLVDVGLGPVPVPAPDGVPKSIVPLLVAAYGPAPHPLLDVLPMRMRDAWGASKDRRVAIVAAGVSAAAVVTACCLAGALGRRRHSAAGGANRGGLV